MLKFQPIMKCVVLAAVAMTLCTPLLLNAQTCCSGEKEGDNVSTEISKKTGYLGITGTDLSDGMKKALNIESGIVVETVAEASPAEKAGIKTGDVISEIDKQKVTDFENLRKIIMAKPDEKVNIVIYRENKKVAKDVTLDAKETKEIQLKMNIPDIDINLQNMKDLMGKGTTELKKQIEELKIEVEKLKAEIEKLKAK